MLQRRKKTEINIKETKNFKRRKNIKEEREKLKRKTHNNSCNLPVRTNGGKCTLSRDVCI